MFTNSDNWHPEVEAECLRQKALIRYRCLKRLKKSELDLEDRLFFENFEAAMVYLWDFPITAITSSVDTIAGATGWNEAN